MSRSKKAKFFRPRAKREAYTPKNDKMPSFKGTISVTQSGFGFVTVEDGSQDIFIPPRYIGSAMDKDLVEGKILPDIPGEYRDPSKGPAGRITAVIERARNTIVGEMLAGYKVRPLNKKLPSDINITGQPRGAKKGDWVELSLVHSEKAKTQEDLRGSISSVIGKAGSIQADLMAVIKEYDLPKEYTAEQNEEALKIVPREITRSDLTNLFCVTIDPQDAKDFDDAVSVSPGKNDNELELGVHISDVAAWISPGSKFDKEAKKRSFTAYLPGKTLPMLPKALTAAISLKPGKDSLAHTIIFTVDKNTGKILSSKRFHSKVRITKRLTFEEVQDFIDGKKPEGWDKKFCEKMQIIVDLTVKMRKYRKDEEAFLELLTSEIRVLCDEEHDKIIGLKKEVQRQADELVEDCMLAGNSEVAKELLAKTIPGIFRIHPEPTEEKLMDFSAFMEGTFHISTGDLSSRKACNHFLKNIPDDHKKPVIINAFLRSLPRAYYVEYPELHFGLGKTRYSHFTSPIRRYPDLVVHQQLWSSDTNTRLRSKKTMMETAESCSKKEINNDEAFYAANDRMKLQYLKEHSESPESKLYEAVITRITSAGFLADIAELGIYGFVPAAYVGNTHYDSRDRKLSVSRSHQSFKCGDFIYLQLERIDFIKGSAIFRPVS